MATGGVRHGISFYVDHDRSWAAQRQWLISDRSAIVWSNIVAIFLTLATARFFPILKRFLSILWPRKPAVVGDTNLELNTQVTQPHNSPAPGSPVADPPENASSSQNVHISVPAAVHTASSEPRDSPRLDPLDQVDDEHSAGEAGVNLVMWTIKQLKPRAVNLPGDHRPPVHLKEYFEDVRNHLKGNFREIILGLTLGLGLIVLQVAFLAVSIFSGSVVSDSVALSRSPHCALRLPILDNASAIVDAQWSKHFHDLETESAEYASRCYPANARSEECSYFYNQSIHFSVKHNDSCPFQGDLCLYGPSGAFTMTTGMIHPKTIGINTRLNYRFERTTTCSPLRMDDGRFIQRHTKDGKDHFRYLYGGFSGTSLCDPYLPNCTWDLPIEITSKPSYRVFGTSKGPFTADMGWQPIPELDPPNDTSLALLVIGNIGIAYPAPSHDPIFPAQKQLSNGAYYNINPYDALLACNDRTTYFDPDGVTNGSVRELALRGWKDDESQTIFTMLAHSLLFSDTGNAIKHISGEGLEAQSNLVGITSLILSPEQWKIEAERLFASSLARIQITARNIARGTSDAEILPPSRNLMDDQPALRNVCSIYKFRSTGWKNLSVAGVLGSFIAGTLLIALSFTRKETEELWFEAYLIAFLKLCRECPQRVGVMLENAKTKISKSLKSLRTKPQPVRLRQADQGRAQTAPGLRNTRTR